MAHAVKGVRFTLERGECLAVVGESGAGKSTVGRMVLRLIEPNSGSVTFDGIDVLATKPKQLRALRQRMQMIFQDPYSSLDPRMTIKDAVAEPLLVHTDTGRVTRESVPSSCSTRSASAPATSSAIRPSCPAVSSSASRSPGR